MTELKCHSSTGVFAYFTSKNHPPGLSITGTLAWNGLIVSIEYMVPKESILHVLQNVF